MIRFDTPGDEARMLLDSAARFASEHYGLTKRAELVMADPSEIPAHWATMGALGWLAAPVPLAADGLGLSPATLLPLISQIGAHQMLEPFGPAVLHCATFLSHALPDADAHLGAMLAGERIEVMIEPGPVVATSTGTGFHLSGSVPNTLGAAAAQIIWVVAEAPDAPLLFRLDAADIKRVPTRLIDGQSAASLSIDLVTSPVKTAPLENALDIARDMALFGVLAETSGVISALFEATLEYVKFREQFGRPVGKFQTVQHRMAEMYIHHQEALSMAQLAAEAVPSDDLGFRRKILSAARVKLADAARTVSREAVQLHGGMGVTDDMAIGHLVKRLLVLAQQGGPRHANLTRYRDAV